MAGLNTHLEKQAELQRQILQKDEITGKDLYLLLKPDLDFMRQGIKELQDTQRTMDGKLANIEKDVKNLSTTTKEHTEQISKVNGEIQTIKYVQDSLSEKTDRLARATNLVMMNIPETDEAMDVVRGIMQIILPNHNLTLREHRIGRPIKNGKPRPLKVHLNSRNDVLTALSNCKNLKGMEQFKGIPVLPDETKIQQQLRKDKRDPNNANKQFPISSTPERNNTKRAAPDNAMPHTSKQSRLDEEAMDSSDE
ncbi:unnamed protein product [Orchesella dallaii]|uniref:Uncharacterized protein n=1 Tax=Orchesella dallaii TaxID=48710 RepID=A0ABP1RX99_9HEXA